jgi:hypothetical protein
MLFLSFISGCVVLPVPVDYYQSESRENIENKISEVIVPGKTCKDEVFLILGEPDDALDDDRSLVYRNKKVKYLIFWGITAGYIGSAGVGEWDQDYHLEINFDENGIVTNTSFRKGYGPISIEKWDDRPAFPEIVVSLVEPFQLDNKFISLDIKDTRNPSFTNVASGGKFFYPIKYDPNELEIVRRFFIRKLKGLRKKMGVSSHQKFTVDVQLFSLYADELFFSTVIFAHVKMQLFLNGKNLLLEADLEEIVSLIPGASAEKLSGAMMKALVKIESIFDSNAPNLFVGSKENTIMNDKDDI